MSQKIWDATMLFTELDLLRVRLEYLAPVVDQFVIVECDRDHAGNPHEPLFQRHADEFKEFPITHVLVTDLPGGPDNWQRVWWHRNCQLRGLADADENDIVLSSDLDEIPRREVVATLKDGYIMRHGVVNDYYMGHYYYEPTLKSLGGWTGTRECTVKTLREVSPEGVRHRQDYTHGHAGRPAGWHFSYFGGAERIQRKIKAIAESSGLDRPEFTDLGRIAARVRAGADLYDRGDQRWQRVPLDPNMPKGIEQFIWKEGV